MEFLTRTLSTITGVGLPYTVGAELPRDPDWQGIWTINEGIRKSDQTKCTLFSFDSKSGGGQLASSRLNLARNMALKLKKLRFPGMVKIVESIETDNSVLIATEPLVPLTQVLGQLTDEAKLWGLHSVASTLNLLATQASSIHGNVSPGSIWVNEAGEWKVGSAELVTQVPGESTVFIQATLVPGMHKIAPPEVEHNGWQVAERNPNSIDSWQLGLLINYVFNGQAIPTSTRGKMPQSVYSLHRQLCAGNVKQRATIKRLLGTAGALESPLQEIADSIDSITILDDGQFETFIGKVAGLKSKFPVMYLHNKLVPQLIQAAHTSIFKGSISLPLIIELAHGMAADQYAKTVVPVIVKMFSSPDRAIRLQLLNHLPEYVDALDKRVASDKIFPLLATGFADSEPVMRENSVKSITVLIDKLNDSLINGELLRLLAKSQTDTVPEIRANTTILLGRIAHKFNKNSRANVLVAAFSRALRDSYVQSRISALLSIAATVEHFSPAECCAKLIGALGPSLIDKDPAVRQQASVTIDMVLKKIEAHARTMDTDAPPATTSKPATPMPAEVLPPSRVLSAPTSTSSNTKQHQTTSMAAAFGAAFGQDQPGTQSAYSDGDDIEDNGWGAFEDDEVSELAHKTEKTSVDDNDNGWEW